jgi:hypothetical protein
VKAVDETPIRADRAGPDKTSCACFGPLYGECDEVCVAFVESRQHACVKELPGAAPQPGAVLPGDGHAACGRYAAATAATHAPCRAHTRRGGFEALDAEPQATACALKTIARVCEVGAAMREKSLRGERKRVHRLAHAKPLVEQCFAWVGGWLAGQGRLASNELTPALAYARERKALSMAYLGDEQVRMAANPLQRAARPIPIGRKNWLFCRTQFGLQPAGMVQGPVTISKPRAIDPYASFVDALQRVRKHPAPRVAEFTPRLCMQHFVEQPLRSDLRGSG